MIPSPTPYQKRVIWNALTGLAMATIGGLVVGLILLVAGVISFLQPVLIPIAVAGIVAYLLEPLVRLLIQRGLSRMRAVIVVFLGFFGFILITAAIIVPKTYVQASELVGQRDKIYETAKSRIQSYFQDHPDHIILDWVASKKDAEGKRQPSKAEAWLHENAGQIAHTTWGLLARGFQGFSSILGMIIGIFLIPIYLWFFLIESQSIQKNWESFIPLRASRFKREFVATLTEINSYLIAFFRGQMLVSAIDGALVGITLTLFDLPYGLLIGVFVAILGLLPYVGNLLCLIPALLISLAHFSVPENQHAWLGQMGTNVWIYPVIVTGIFVGVQQINSFVTAPKIVGDSVGLHPMTVIFSVFFWTLLLGGALGTLLAVPLSASVKVLFRRYIWVKKIKEPEAPPPGGTGGPSEPDPDSSAASADVPEPGGAPPAAA
jgi:predicted PurR-regulated permease PerM